MNINYRMNKHGFYLIDGYVRKFRYGKVVNCCITESQRELIKYIPESIIELSKVKPISFKIQNGTIHFVF